MYNDDEDEEVYAVPRDPPAAAPQAAGPGEEAGRGGEGHRSPQGERQTREEMPMGMPGEVEGIHNKDEGVHEAEINPRFTELCESWQAEEHGPELLAWKGDLYEEFVTMVEQQEQMVEATLAGGEASTEDTLLVAPLYQMDIARTKYVMASYVRSRLRKLQRSAGHVATNPEALKRLSEYERTFLQKYLALLYRHHRTALLQDLPKPYAHESQDDTCPDDLAVALSVEPDMDEFVFVKVLTDLGDIEWEPGGEFSTLSKGDQYILRYGAVRDYIFNGDLLLI